MSEAHQKIHQDGVFVRGMGEPFTRLHPQLQRRFGVGLRAGYACVGRGTMLQIVRAPWWARPLLRFGATRNLMFPESGSNVPFTIMNVPYLDGFGRETVSFVRTMEVTPRRRRRFDATMIFSSARGCVVDYLGTHQHLAVDLDLSVTATGGLRLRSGEQRFYEGILGFRFPALLTGTAELEEHFDDDRNCFVINLTVRHRFFGAVFGYRGEFTCEFPELPGASSGSGTEVLHLTELVQPLREERRE